MNAEAVRVLIDYQYGVYTQLWDCIMHLSDEQFVQEFDYSFGSVRNHMVHLINADRRWVARVREVELPPHYEPTAFPTRNAVRALWDEVEGDVRAYVASLDDAQLARTLVYDMPHRGGIKRDPVWQIIVHLVNHGTDHRAQILALLHQLGALTFEQDMMIYQWKKTAVS